MLYPNATEDLRWILALSIILLDLRDLSLDLGDLARLHPISIPRLTLQSHVHPNTVALRSTLSTGNRSGYRGGGAMTISAACNAAIATYAD